MTPSRAGVGCHRTRPHSRGPEMVTKIKPGLAPQERAILDEMLAETADARRRYVQAKAE